MSAWTPPIAVNGALADILVSDFGGSAFAPNTTLPPDSRLCLTLHYASSAASQVRLFLAIGAAAAAAAQILVYDSAQQLNPGPDLTQYLTGIVIDVPIQPGGTPYQLRITKANTTANIWLATTVAMGPGC